MPYLYILKSLKDKNLYVGTCNVLDVRLNNHNRGLVRSTKHRRPFILVYDEEFNTLSEARKKEWKLKYTPWGGKLKKKLASSAAGSSNGRTSGSGPDNSGSNPDPAALETNVKEKSVDPGP